jgi:hypothetical protein
LSAEASEKFGGRQRIQTFASATIGDYMPEAIYPIGGPTSTNRFQCLSGNIVGLGAARKFRRKHKQSGVK